MQQLLLSLELARWGRAGKKVRLWWRDDDAAGPDKSLSRLLDLSWKFGVPITLAVVPSGDMAGLGALLAHAPAVTVVQHGVDHLNRRSGPQAGEFPEQWAASELKVRLAWGWARMKGLPGAFPAFVPPWNDLHPALEGALCDLDYCALSAGGGPHAGQLPRFDANLDILRWRGGARFRGVSDCLRRLREAMAHRRRTGRWDEPVGVLTHHLAHDAAAWRFLETFLEWTSGRPALHWTSFDAMVDNASPMAPKRAPHWRRVSDL